MITTINLSSIRTDGGTQSRAAIDQQVADDYASAMSDGALLPPVTVFHDGTHYWLADGFHRVHAAVGLGWLQVDAAVRQGTQRDAVLFSLSANAVHGLRRSNADKRRAVEVVLADPEWSTWSQGEIAKACGVSREYVNRVVSERRSPALVIDHRSAGEPDTVTSDDGPPRDWDNVPKEPPTDQGAQGDDEMPARRSDDAGAVAALFNRAPIAIATSAPPAEEKKKPRNGDEWYTPDGPKRIASRIRRFLGHIELDPASCDAANLTIQAERFFTKEDDGLSKIWIAKTFFLNPPYSLAGEFVGQAIASYEAGNLGEGFMLLNANTSSAWFTPLWSHLLCFIEGRVSFDAGDGGDSATGWSPSVLVYFGPRPEEFARDFADLGAIVTRLTPAVERQGAA